jgi:uncharacterized membrane protein
MKWRTFGKALALALIGQAVVRIGLTDATGSDLFRSIVALIFLLVLIGFVLNTIASVREADRPRQDLSQHDHADSDVTASRAYARGEQTRSHRVRLVRSRP